MLIIYGTHVTRKWLGRVAEYCPFCHGIAPARVAEVRSHTHLYYIPLSCSTLQGHEVTCERCRNALNVDIAAHRGYSREWGVDLERLIAETNPHVEDLMLRQLEMEERAATGDASAADRETLLLQPFLEIAPEYEARCASTHIDGLSAMLMATWVIVPWLLVIVGSGSGSRFPGRLLIVLGLALAALLAVVIIGSLATDPKRFLNRRYRRFIGERLVDLDPSAEEITHVLDTLRRRGLKLGRKVKPPWVLDAVRDVRGGVM